MRIWIDLANSPQVPFFRPIIEQLKTGGHEVLITSRDFAQTTQLADMYGLTHTPIGAHGGSRWSSIVRKTVGRSAGLRQWAKAQGRIDMALSHNSYAQALAAAALRLPFVTLMDYEHQPFNHLCFRMARRVIVPQPFPEASLRRYGAGRKSARYPGLKEQMYLSDFVPSADYLEQQSLPSDRMIVVMRPPAPWAAYHRFENTLFDEVLLRLARNKDALIIFLPRIPAQGDAVRQLGMTNVLIPPTALDGPNLLYHADLVISGGGTMNREAAVLGTPTYTVFKGQLGAVDKYLIERGRMVQISEPAGIDKIVLAKRTGHGGSMLDGLLVRQTTELIVNAI